MSDAPIKTATGITASALFVLLAANGKSFWEGMEGAWNFLLHITNSAPLGVGAFFTAVAFAVMATITLRRWWPRPANEHRWAAIIEGFSVLVALSVALMQVHGRNGIMIGMLAGFVSSFVARLVMGVATYVGNLWRTRDDPPAPPA